MSPRATVAEAPVVERFTLGPFETNCYLVRAGRRGSGCFLVDASYGPGEMVERARALGERVGAIVLTHAHVDHIAGLEEVRGAFPEAPVMIHEAEAEFLGEPLLNLSIALGEPVVCRPATRLLRDGDTLDLAGASWRVLHPPGHSPGGITLVEDGSRVALVGDTLFAGSVGRTDFPTSDPRALTRSIRERLYTLPEATRVLPGHGPETTIGRERSSNPFVRG